MVIFDFRLSANYKTLKHERWFIRMARASGDIKQCALRFLLSVPQVDHDGEGLLHLQPIFRFKEGSPNPLDGNAYHQEFF